MEDAGTVALMASPAELAVIQSGRCVCLVITGLVCVIAISVTARTIEVGYGDRLYRQQHGVQLCSDSHYTKFPLLMLKVSKVSPLINVAS